MSSYRECVHENCLLGLPFKTQYSLNITTGLGKWKHCRYAIGIVIPSFAVEFLNIFSFHITLYTIDVYRIHIFLKNSLK